MNEYELSHSEHLFSTLDKLEVRIKNGVTEEEAISILKVCNKISERSQNVDVEMNVHDSLELFLKAETLVLHLLRQYKDSQLPLSEDVEQLSLVKDSEKWKILSELRKKYPFAVRSVHNPHLYLPLLQKTVETYGQTENPVELDWRHELGHFSRYVSQKNGNNFQKESEKTFNFLCILDREADYLGYQPAIQLDESKLTVLERIDVVRELGDLSNGDARALAELEKKLPFASLRQAIQKIFRK